jgi:hypothetical protein
MSNQIGWVRDIKERFSSLFSDWRQAQGAEHVNEISVSGSRIVSATANNHVIDFF